MAISTLAYQHIISFNISLSSKWCFTKGCITYREEDFIRAKELIEEGSVYLDGFISKRYYFSQVQEMMEQALENKGINMKTIMDFEEE